MEEKISYHKKSREVNASQVKEKIKEPYVMRVYLAGPDVFFPDALACRVGLDPPYYYSESAFLWRLSTRTRQTLILSHSSFPCAVSSRSHYG